ncbi:MAG TPA: hypothetical protein ENG42_00975 [Candidatus Aenigmarchaeota archaeon]|nr:MAG: hypothetical protein DRP03_03580 [Candidatus Aenigmarchaeota archaeon]HDD46023.1 hypothetical protein [Candidatus Aenigmarchaeota archaeon]
MKRKAQLEFVAIIVVAIIMVLVIFFISLLSLRPQSQVSSIGEDVKMIREAVKGVLRESIDDALLAFYYTGGFEGSPLGHVRHGGSKIAIWKDCGNIFIPNIENSIVNYLKIAIRDRLKNSVFYGKNITFDLERLEIGVRLTSKKIVFEITLPFTFEGKRIERPYIIEKGSDIYTIIKFSKEFLSKLNNTNLFEILTLSTMLQSNPDSSYWVPVSGVVYGCGNYMLIERTKVAEGIKKIANYVASHIVFNKNTKKLASNPFFPISLANYDLKIRTFYPDEWDISKNLRIYPQPSIIVAKQEFPLISFCSKNYLVLYTFKYPIILTIKDEIMNQWLRFGVMVSIENNMPGKCKGYEHGDYEELCVKNAKYDVTLKIINESGKPIKDAVAFFHTCFVGKSDENGIIRAKVPAVVGELKVYKHGYISYGNLTTYHDLKEKTIKLGKLKGEIEVRYYGIEMRRNGGGYEITGGRERIDQFLEDGEKIAHVTVYLDPINRNIFTNEPYPLVITNFNESGVFFAMKERGIYPAKYQILGWVINSKTNNIVGYINKTVEISKDVENICITLPFVTNLDGNEIPLEDIKSIEEVIESSDDYKIIDTEKGC